MIFYSTPILIQYVMFHLPCSPLITSTLIYLDDIGRIVWLLLFFYFFLEYQQANGQREEQEREIAYI